jgi:hypothetical protein
MYELIKSKMRMGNLYGSISVHFSAIAHLFLFLMCHNIIYQSERSRVWVLGVSILSLSTILVFDFGIVPTVWYFLYFILIHTCNTPIIYFSKGKLFEIQ